MNPGKWFAAVALLAVAFAAFELALFLRSARLEVQATAGEVRELVSESRGVIAGVKKTADGMSAYSAEQMKVFSSTANKKSQQAAWDAAATLIKILRKVDQQTVPGINETIADLDSTAASLRAFVAHTDVSINQGLLPESTKTITKAGAGLDSLNVAIQQASERANASLDAIYALTSDPHSKLTLDELLAISRNIDNMTASFAEAAKQMPSIAASVEKMARTSSKLQKFVIASQIASALLRIWF
jgi:hypothetical protein